MKRADQVKLLVVLESIVSAFLVGGGAAILALAGLSAITLILGGVHIILGLIAFPAVYGLWTGKSWTWRFALVLNIVSILWSVGQEYMIMTIQSDTRILLGSFYGTIVFTLFSLAIIYYLTRPNVKVLYSRRPASTSLTR